MAPTNMGACLPMGGGGSLEPLATLSVLPTTTCWATWIGATHCKRSQGHANNKPNILKTT